ncbi:MAG: oligosaccharide flippase family protein [Chloroflexi bacterium]|nr:oligosaccharide flippase family protein [Chloroflexota bacterium]
MNVARTVGWNVLVQLGSRAAQLLFSGISTLILVRSLGPSTYGEYALVIAIVSLCGLIAEAGIGRIATRDMSRNPAEEASLLSQAVLLRLLLGLLATTVAMLSGILLHLPLIVLAGIALGSLTFYLDALASVGLIFQVRLKMQYDAIAMVCSKAAVLLTVLLAALLHASVLIFFCALLVGSGMMAIVAWFFATKLTTILWTYNRQRSSQLLRQSIPSGIALLVAVVYLKVDGVLLGVFKGATALGIYSAAYRPIEYFLLAGSVIVNPIYPLLSKNFATNHREFLHIYQQSFIAVIIPLGAIMLLNLAYAPQLLSFVFGASYQDAAGPYRILTIVLPLLFCNGWQALALLTADRQTITMLIDSGGLIINLSANLLLIPRFGSVGCASAALLTAIFVSSAGNVAAHRHAGATLPLSAILRTAFAVGICATPLSVINHHLWPLTGAVALLLYLSLLLAFRVLQVNQLRNLLPARLTATAKGLLS